MPSSPRWPSARRKFITKPQVYCASAGKQLLFLESWCDSPKVMSPLVRFKPQTFRYAARWAFTESQTIAKAEANHIVGKFSLQLVFVDIAADLHLEVRAERKTSEFEVG